MALADELKDDEDFVSHAYQDSLGYWTIGYGTLIDERKGGGIDQEEAEYLLLRRIEKAAAGLKKNLPWVTSLDQVRYEVLVNMAFNMGLGDASHGLLSFTNTLASIKSGRYEEASDRMLKSKWAKQVGRRAVKLSRQMRTGLK